MTGSQNMASSALRPLWQSAGLAVLMLDPDLHIIAIRGLPALRAARGQALKDIVPFLEGYEAELRNIGTRDRPALDLPRLHAKGMIKGYDGYFSLHACRAQAGQGVILLLQDVSAAARAEQQRLQERNELRMTRRQLELATADADAANRAKSTFLAHVSHELKTPLAVITGNADILSSLRLQGRNAGDLAEIEADVHAYAADIQESGEFLAALVNDLLDIVRAETGRFAISETSFDWNELAQDVLTSLGRLPSAKTLRLETLGNEPLWNLRADPLRLRQVLINLLTNAIHVSPAGGLVRLSWRHQAAELLISIEDQGAGITLEDAARVFEPFEGASGGTGLGLTIARNLVEMHQGAIGIEPLPQGGSRAWFTLPSSRLLENQSL